MFQLAGCEDGGCPGLWIVGDRLLAQGEAVTDPQLLAQTNPAPGETLVALPKQMLGQALSAAITALI